MTARGYSQISGAPMADPPPGYKRMTTLDLDDASILEIMRGDTGLAQAWATLRVGIRKVAKEKEFIYQKRAELQLLLDLLTAAGVGIAISIEEGTDV